MLFTVAVGCASQAPSEYERLAALQTPVSWVPDSIWTIAIVDSTQRLSQSMTVRLTEDKGESCASGDWHHVEILAQEPAQHPQFQGIAAYQVTGRAFVLNLTANLCDSDNELRGELSETGLSGSYWSGGPLGGELIGTFYGVVVADAAAPNKLLHATRETRAREQ